jgi:UDP-GlcNAc:undecaprenyl-phosphate GlcNAc-1-phosphate transferase
MTPEALRHIGQAAMAGGTALAVTFLLTPLVRAIAVRWGWSARPTSDRWGRRVVARLGGVAMFLGFLAALLLWVPLEPQVKSLLVGVGMVFALGLVDDLRRMPAYAKLVSQLLIGCLVVLGGIRVALIQQEWLSIPLSVLWFVLVINAFNLLDNMDGLAAGVGAIAAGFCAVHALLAGQVVVATLAAIVSGVCVGFLFFNFPPAKIFMGDSGSHLLGLSLAVLALMGSWRHSTQLLSILAIPTLVLAVPIFDTCFVTVQRLLHRQNPFVGGTDHVSHRLAILGLSARQTVIALYGVSACLGCLSVVSVAFKPLTTLMLWLVALMVLILCGRYLAQVNVYRVERQPPSLPPPEAPRPSTLIETMLLHKRRLLEILVDFCLISSAYVCAYLLRFEGLLTPALESLIVQSLPLILVVKLSCFAGCGLYRGVWRYLGLSDTLLVFRSVTLGSILSALTLLYLWRFEGYSRAVLIIDWMLTFLAIGGARVVERILDEWIGRVTTRGTPTLIIGAGDTGAHVLQALRYDRKATRCVMGLLDDDARKHGNRICGCAVLGGRAKLPELLDRCGIREVLIAISDPPGELLHYIQRCCQPRGVTWKVVTAGIHSAP